MGHALARYDTVLTSDRGGVCLLQAPKSPEAEGPADRRPTRGQAFTFRIKTRGRSPHLASLICAGGQGSTLKQFENPLHSLHVAICRDSARGRVSSNNDCSAACHEDFEFQAVPSFGRAVIRR